MVKYFQSYGLYLLGRPTLSLKRMALINEMQMGEPGLTETQTFRPDDTHKTPFVEGPRQKYLPNPLASAIPWAH